MASSPPEQVETEVPTIEVTPSSDTNLGEESKTIEPSPPPGQGASPDLVQVKVTAGKRCKDWVKGHVSVVLTVAAVIVPTVVLVPIRTYNIWEPTERQVVYVRFIGETYLNMFQGLVIPLVTGAMITSVGTMDLLLLRKIGGTGIIFFLLLDIISGFVGAAMTHLFLPGDDLYETDFLSDDEFTTQLAQGTPKVLLQDKLMDLGRAVIPPNIITAALQTYSTKIGCPEFGAPCKERSSDTEAIKKCCVTKEYIQTPNALGLTVFSVFLGIALARAGVYARPVLAFFQSLTEATILVTTWVLWLTPLGTLSLTAADALEASGGEPEVLYGLLLFVGTVALGLLIVTLLYPLLYIVILRQNPLPFLKAIGPALVTAATTSSSLITVPQLLECLDAAGVNKKVTRILIPLGTRLNLNGTAVFCAAATLFIGQTWHLDVLAEDSKTYTQTIIGVAIASSALSMSTIGVPGGAHPTIQILLGIIGLSGSNYRFILPTEIILDLLRSTVNVLGCAFITAIVSKWYHEDLKKEDSYDFHQGQAVVDTLALITELTDPADPEEDILLNPAQVSTPKKKKKHKKKKDEHHLEAGSAGRRARSKGKKKKMKVPLITGKNKEVGATRKRSALSNKSAASNKSDQSLKGSLKSKKSKKEKHPK